MKYLLKRVLLVVCSVSLAVCLCHTAMALQRKGAKDTEATKASAHSIGSVRLYDIPNKETKVFTPALPAMDGRPATPATTETFVLGNHYLIVVFTDPQNTDDTDSKGIAKEDLAQSNLTIKFLPSGKVIPPSAIVSSNEVHGPKDPYVNTKNLGGGNNFKLVQIGLKDDDSGSWAEPGDDEVMVTLNRVHFGRTVDDNGKEVSPAGEATGVTGTGTIINRGNLDKRIEQDYEALKNSVAHAKTDDEKDAFIGLNVVVPSGGGKAEGGADISFNKDLRPATLGQAALFNHIILGFKLKKASEETSDARHFEIGINFRKTFLRLNNADLNTIKSALAGATSVDKDGAKQKEGEALAAINRLQKNFIRDYIWDNALRFEGDVSDRGISNVSNLLWDSQLQVATVSRAFAGQTGFWNFRWVPVGFEFGGNLTNNDDPTQAKRSLARLKSGGELNLIFKAASLDEPISRVVLSAKALERYLFKNEATLDEMTKKVVMTDKGSKYWLQADLKVSSGFRVGVSRVGFKLTFERGFLPPVYSFVKTFKFSVFFETNDDDNSGNTKVQ